MTPQPDYNTEQHRSKTAATREQSVEQLEVAFNKPNSSQSFSYLDDSQEEEGNKKHKLKNQLPELVFVGDEGINIIDLTPVTALINPHTKYVEDIQHEYHFQKDQTKEEEILENKCRACGKVFLQITRHLVTQKGKTCMEKSYTKDEIDKHKMASSRKSSQKHREECLDGNSAKQQRMDEGPTNINIHDDPVNDNDPNLLDNKCRGCGREFVKLLQHLMSQNGLQCNIENYNEEEIEAHKLSKKKKVHTVYNKEHRDNINEAQAVYNKEHRDEIKEAQAVYDKEHRDKKNEAQAVYNKEHRDKINEAQAVYDKEHREEKKEAYKKRKECMSMSEASSVFSASIVWGAIYPCICCHRTRFRNNVTKADILKLKQRDIFEKAVDLSMLSTSSKFYIKSSYWICKTCMDYIRRNSLPKVSSMNAMHVYDRPDCLKLSEVENVLLAPRINFIKMIRLPVSRMLGIRDRIVNVPITSNIIRQTVECLPRTLEEAQVIPISLRKKKSMVTSHFQQWINPEKLREAVRYLKSTSKYPPYEEVNFDMHKVDSLLDRAMDDCEEEMEVGGSEQVQDAIDDDDAEEVADIEYVKNDAVRKHQTDTSESSMLLPENIESQVKTKSKTSKEDSGLILAPGEDQIPRNILREKNPFVLHFPILFPDGKGGLHDPDREKKLGTQQWIMQKILNVNPMFAQNKPFLFSAVHYVEQQQLMARMNISFMRGKMTSSEDGGKFLTTEDGFAVFDGIPGSPRYWQKMKYDLIAKMEQLGPPQYFYTLSCANKRWDENLATMLAKNRPDLNVMHCQEEKRGETFLDLNRKETKEKEEYEDEDEIEDIIEEVSVPEQDDSEYFVHEELSSVLMKELEEEYTCKLHNNCSRKSLHAYLDKKDANNLQAENVLDVTRNFDSRVKSFRRNILMAEQSELKIRYYHDRVEFQARYRLLQ